ncbi:hypothetical protein [Thauera butanivorans]|uniref:hypothetical protein n=1 Tax=Thauera butanivorans TaxID=86174 RepID=UPI00083903E4|nr:hypothetical protein [Thauera butanivorans]
MIHRLYLKYAVIHAFMLLATLGAVAHAQSAGILQEPPASIQFSGRGYHLAWQSNPIPDYVKYEYLPEGQRLPRYQDMLLLELLTNGLTVAEVVRKQLDFLRQREGSDPVFQHRILANERTGEFLLDFTLSAEDPENGKIIEWNAYRYIPHRAADGKQGVLLYGYSRRSYGDEEGLAFLHDLKERTPRDIQALGSASIPVPGDGSRPSGSTGSAER